MNCRTGSAEKSLSFWLLLLWMLSDSANLLGAVLTKQLTTLVTCMYINTWAQNLGSYTDEGYDIWAKMVKKWTLLWLNKIIVTA